MRQGKNGQIRGTLKRRLMTNFLLTALIPVLIFAIISQINIQQRLKENLSDRIKSNLDTAEKNLEMVLDKYETILYDFSTDERCSGNCKSIEREAGGIVRVTAPVSGKN